MATHSSILAWRIPWTEALRGLQFIGSHKAANNTKQPSGHPPFPSGAPQPCPPPGDHSSRRPGACSAWSSSVPPGTPLAHAEGLLVALPGALPQPVTTRPLNTPVLQRCGQQQDSQGPRRHRPHRQTTTMTMGVKEGRSHGRWILNHWTTREVPRVCFTLCRRTIVTLDYPRANPRGRLRSPS